MTDYYIFGGNKLPEAFDESKNLYYHRQYRLGDMVARELLIKHNLRLVFSIIKDRKYDKLIFDIEDLMSIGIEGLIKGIDTYNEKINNKISVHLSNCIRYEILNFLRKENYSKKKGYSFVSIDDTACEKDGDFICNGDVFKFDNRWIEDIFIDKMMQIYYKTMIAKMFDMLNDRDREIFKLSYGFVDGNPYIIMEFCPGGDLASKVGRRDIDVVRVRSCMTMFDFFPPE